MGRHDYNPFGTEIPRSGQAADPTKKYTGHERDPNGRADYMLGRTYLYPFMRFSTPDPARDGWSLYAYTGNNPVNRIDPDGEIFETLWDLGNVVVGAVSLANNLREGNLGAAAVDAGGLILDGLATAAPFVPGGASAAIKAGRAADDVVDGIQAGRVADDVIDAATAVGDGLLTSGGKLIGEAGTSSSVRIVEGSASAAEELFSDLARGGVDITPSGHPGQLVRLPSGGIVGFRPLSKSGPATVDVNLPGVNIRKVKFVE